MSSGSGQAAKPGSAPGSPRGEPQPLANKPQQVKVSSRAPARRGALSGEADAVRRAESAEMGCEIAYRREPTQAEGDAAEASDAARNGECFVAMGGWTGRRCRACDRWVWGGPTACEGCVWREERDDARDCGQDDVCKAPPGCQRHWEERNRELVAQLGRLNTRAT